jgi:hypothetical protein
LLEYGNISSPEEFVSQSGEYNQCWPLFISPKQFLEVPLILFTADSLPVENDIPTYDNFKELKQTIQKIKLISTYKTLLSSWTEPLNDKTKILSLIEKGDQYLDRLDCAIKIDLIHYCPKQLSHES